MSGAADRFPWRTTRQRAFATELAALRASPDGMAWLKVYWRRKKANSRRRGIAVLLTFEECLEFWAVRGRWRMQREAGLVMARVNDEGPYHRDNIYCTTASGNAKDTPKWRRRGGAPKRSGLWKPPRPPVPKTPDNPRRLRPVRTPQGLFVNAIAAAAAHGIFPERVRELIRRKTPGWNYE